MAMVETQIVAAFTTMSLPGTALASSKTSIAVWQRHSSWNAKRSEDGFVNNYPTTKKSLFINLVQLTAEARRRQLSAAYVKSKYVKKKPPVPILAKWPINTYANPFYPKRSTPFRNDV